MKKTICLATLVLSGFFTAQENIIFSEDFNDFEKELEWDVLDRDRDGITWTGGFGSDDTADAGWDNEEGGFLIASSYNMEFGASMGPLDSDDVLISPTIEIPDVEGDIILSYKIGVTTDYLHGMKMNDLSYQFFILEEDDIFYPTLTPIDEKRFSDSNRAEERFININDYKGKKINMYWRHYDAFGQFVLILDDVKIVHLPKEEEGVEVNYPTVYPNPAKDILYLGGMKEIISYKIYDRAGRLVKEDSYNEAGINVSHIERGTYIIVVEDGKGKIPKSFKFIKE